MLSPPRHGLRPRHLPPTNHGNEPSQFPSLHLPIFVLKDIKILKIGNDGNQNILAAPQTSIFALSENLKVKWNVRAELQSNSKN